MPGPSESPSSVFSEIRKILENIEKEESNEAVNETKEAE